MPDAPPDPTPDDDEPPTEVAPPVNDEPPTEALSELETTRLPGAAEPVTAPIFGTEPVTAPIFGTEPVTAPLPDPHQVLVRIGEIEVVPGVVRTPVGQFPLAGSEWTAVDQWYPEQRTPTWAIVLAIVGFFCLTVFSLLFLLAKETVYRGYVQVTVVAGPQQYTTRVPVLGPAQVTYVSQQVNYVRSLAALD